MSLFSFKPEARSLLSKIGKPRLFLFFGAIVVLILGNTLAANISLNSGGNVEFGQGVALTTACDDDVTVTPYSTFVNEEGAGDFMFTSVSVTGISENCDGKIFTIKAFEEGSDNPLNLYITGGSTTYNSVEVSYTMSGDEGTFSLVDAGLLSDDIIDRERDDGSDSDGFTVNLFTEDIPSSEAVASARDVDRITIESRDGEKVYEIGDVGPGGGVIFYDAGSTQVWGRWIEAAPSNWSVSGDAVASVWCNNSLDVNYEDSTFNIGNAVSNYENMISPNCMSGISYDVDSFSVTSGFSWFVPTRAELQAMFASGVVNGLIDDANGYWSSNGGSGGSSWIGTIVTLNGGVGGYNKTQIGPRLRPIRYVG